MSRDLLIALAAAIALHAGAAAVLPWLDVSAPRRPSASPASFTVALTAPPAPAPAAPAPSPVPSLAPIQRAKPEIESEREIAGVYESTLAPLATPVAAPVTAAIPVETPAPMPIAAAAAAPAPAIAPLPMPSPVIETAAPAPAPAPATREPDPPKAAPGTGSEKPREAPAVTHDPPPAYPRSARRRGWTGVVDLRVEVLASGRCGRIEITRSSGHAVLDQAAEKAVKRWRFEPGTIGGRPAGMWVELPIEFRLED